MEKLYALLAFCEGNPPVTGGLPSQREVAGSFDVFCDAHRKQKRLNKLELSVIGDALTVMWRHCNNVDFGIYFMLDRRYPITCSNVLLWLKPSRSVGTDSL